ncbi:MAG: glycosyl hydrolase family 65 protein, partial [Verrucomicrobiota bacterium]
MRRSHWLSLSKSFENSSYGLIAILWLFVSAPAVCAGVLEKQKLLDRESFWDNRDWEWYQENIPFLDTPDPAINTTYYYRWELITKHLTYGSPESGYSFTEFIDRPFWSGAYGAISCPAGHQLYEVRWLRDARYARDYARYWFRTPGAQPRNYSTWLADSVWAIHEVHPDPTFTRNLLPDLTQNFAGWEKRHWVPEVGLFWQIGHDDGMEININSRQTKDTVRGAPGYRPSFNAYMWADAVAIAKIAELAGDRKTAEAYRAKAAGIKAKMQELLWDPKREFFFHRFKNDEADAEGNVVKAGTLTYQSGRFAGSPHGREQIGFVPWQFGMPDPGYEAAWKFLMDPNYFYAEFGPTTVERNDPLFHLSKTCCWWSGMSWPYATTQTLKALANLLQQYEQNVVTRSDYFKLLQVYTRTHQKNGRPYIAEAAHPETGSWEGHDSYNHSEHYFHSGYTDLIITGLIGLRPRPDDILELDPLAPPSWDYFALDDLLYRGRLLSVLWDRSGARYGFGPGLHVLVDGKKLATVPRLQKLTTSLPPAKDAVVLTKRKMNFAVNNEGTPFPKAAASFVPNHRHAPLAKIHDGNFWYHVSPPNRFTFEGSSNRMDWCTIDFGRKRRIDTIKAYLLDDGERISAPLKWSVEIWQEDRWQPVVERSRAPHNPEGRRANVITFEAIDTEKIRATLVHRPGFVSGLSELAAWGPETVPYEPPPLPEGNLALNRTGQGFPKASASFTSNYDRVERVNDGRSFFTPSPSNRWTSWSSPNSSDWLEID